MQQILLVPEPFVFQNQCLGILEWQENIMKVNDYTRLELWDYVEYYVQDVTSNAGNVTRVNEQNVISFQRVQVVCVNFFDPLGKVSGSNAIKRANIYSWLRVNGRKLGDHSCKFGVDATCGSY